MKRPRHAVRHGLRACAATLAIALVAGQVAGQAPLDVDRDGKVEIYTDLVYIARYLLGLPPVPASFRASGTPIPSDDVIRANIEAAAGTPAPTDTPSSTATPTASATSTAAATSPATTVSPGVTSTAGPSRTASRTGTATRSPTPSPTFSVPEGSEVVKAAAEVSVQNPETFEVIGIGCASAGGCQAVAGQGAFRLAAAPRTALRTGGGPRGVEQACAGGGTKLETCANSVQTIVFTSCIEPGVAGHTNERNGTSQLTVGDPGFCDDMIVDPTKAVVLELRNYRHIERNGQGAELARLEATWVDTLSPSGAGCRLASDSSQLVNGLQEVSGSLHFECRTGALALPCPRGSTNITLTTAGLEMARDSGGFPCELGLRIKGSLHVEDRDRNLGGQSCVTAFTQTFGDLGNPDPTQRVGYLLTEAPVGDGTSKVRQEGRLSVDAFGPLDFDTRRQSIELGTPGPASGQDGSVRFPDGADCPTGGDGEIEVRRPPLVNVQSASATAGLTRGAAPPRELRQRLYRATNGPVYQVLQNVDDLANFGADALQITTIAASEAGAVGQCAFTAGAEALPQAVAPVAGTEVFPIARVFKSVLIPFAGEPQWNRNGGETQGGARNDGVVCIGPGCLNTAICPNGAQCVAFTLHGPGASPITTATSNAFGGIPAAKIVSVPRVNSPVGCRDLGAVVTYSFGTDFPTIEIPQCSPFPSPQRGDGFRLPNGSSIVIAYDASFASLFNASVAGFPIDTDGNQVVCPPGQGTRVLHLGVSELGSVEAPRFHFEQNAGGAPQVVFDFLGGDPEGIQTVTGCIGISRLTTCQ